MYKSLKIYKQLYVGCSLLRQTLTMYTRLTSNSHWSLGLCLLSATIIGMYNQAWRKRKLIFIDIIKVHNRIQKSDQTLREIKMNYNAQKHNKSCLSTYSPKFLSANSYQLLGLLKVTALMIKSKSHYSKF